MSSWEYLTIWRYFLPASWNTEHLIPALHPELLQGALEESSCHETRVNPCRGRRQAPMAVPVCGGQNPKAGPVSIPGAEPLHNPRLSMHRPPCLTLPSLGKLLLRCPLLPAAFPDPLAILYGSLLPGTLPWCISVPSGGIFHQARLGFLKGRNRALRFVSASSKY